MSIKEKYKRCVVCKREAEIKGTKSFVQGSTDIYLKCPDNHYSRVCFSDTPPLVKVELTKVEFEKFLKGEFPIYDREWFEATTV